MVFVMLVLAYPMLDWETIDKYIEYSDEPEIGLPVEPSPIEGMPIEPFYAHEL